jgi:hypothetical protein
MENYETIERFGWLTKEEPLSTLDDANLNLNVCIFESNAPYFGYYNDDPNTDKPQYLFWVLDKYYTLEHLTRSLEYIKANCQQNLDAYPGNIQIVDDSYHVIQMLNIEHYSYIHSIQSMLQKTGVGLKKSMRKIKNQMGLITLNRFVYLHPVQKGIYLEKGQAHRGYFEIPRHLEWEDFKALATEVKYDTSLIFFDAARASFVENEKIVNLVRIYRENLTIERLLAIRDRYLKLLG